MGEKLSSVKSAVLRSCMPLFVRNNVSNSPVDMDSMRISLYDSGVLVLVTLRLYSTSVPITKIRFFELNIGIDIFVSDIFNISATVFRTINKKVEFEAIDKSIPDKI